MHTVTLQKTIAYGDLQVVAASDSQDRSYIGVATGGEDRAVLFIQVERVTVLELERGEVGLYTVMSDRCVGLVFEAVPEGSRPSSTSVQFQAVRMLTNVEPA